ncbi:MAG TPA: hypothetical protein V6D22_00320 [Candidatus Obscuribacterales bacterium]
MAQIIVGHFRDREQAVKAASELTSRHLVAAEPRIVEHDYVSSGLSELSNLNKRQTNLETIVLITGAIAFILGTLVMIWGGSAGALAIAFPALVTLAIFGVAGAGYYGWQLARGPGWRTHHMMASDLLVDGVENANTIEDILVSAGADDVEIRIA